MRILHIYKDYHPVLGGIENHLRWLARGQAARGHEVTALVTNPSGLRTTVQVEEGVTIIRAARLATVASTPLSLSLPWHAWRQRPDIVHLQFPYPVGEISNLLFGRGRATVISYQSDVVRQAGVLRLYNPLLRVVLRRADRILASSPPYVQSSDYLRPLAGRCTVLPIGVETERYARPRPAESAALRQRFPGPLLLFVGRLRYYKGLNYLIEAMAAVPDATLLVAGTGPETASLKAQTVEAGLGERIIFLGDVSDEELPVYYQAADLFVLPSSQRSEAYGIALLEAMASGTAVISTELGTGTSWLNQHGVTGLVTPARDSGALAGAIKALLTDDARRGQMAAAAQARARSEFDLEQQIDRILDIYRDVLPMSDRGADRFQAAAKRRT